MDSVDFVERPTILVVDDTPDNLAVLSSLLKDEYRVKVASSGEKALKVAAAANPPRPDLAGYHDAGTGRL